MGVFGKTAKKLVCLEHVRGWQMTRAPSVSAFLLQCAPNGLFTPDRRMSMHHLRTSTDCQRLFFFSSSFLGEGA